MRALFCPKPVHLPVPWMGGGRRPFSLATSVPETFSLRRIIENGRHCCPGCGAAFCIGSQPEVLKNAHRARPGWIDWSRLEGRLRWRADAPSGEPQIYVSDAESSLTQVRQSKPLSLGSKFARQADWFSRTYTALEVARINKRMLLSLGHANEQLQLLRSGGLTSDSASSSSVATTKDVLELQMKLAQGEGLSEADNMVPSSPRPPSQGQHEERPLICQRCHDLKHDDRGEQLRTSPDDHRDNPLMLGERDRNLLSTLLGGPNNLLVIMLIDLLDMPWSLPPSPAQLLRGYSPSGKIDRLETVLVGSKADLLPAHALQHCIDYLKSLVPSALGVHLVSAKRGMGVDALRLRLLHLSREREANALFLGRTNVGKSSLFNRLVGEERATVSAIPGTTAGLLVRKMNVLRRKAAIAQDHYHSKLDIPSVSSELLLIDLPGLGSQVGLDQLHRRHPPRDVLSSLLSPAECKLLSIKHPLRAARRIMLGKDEVLLIGGIARILVSDLPINCRLMLKVYMRKEVSLVKVPLNETDQFVTTWLGTPRPTPPKLYPPILGDGREDPRWTIFAHPHLACEVEIGGGMAPELVLSDDLGWVSLHLPEDIPARAHVRVYTPGGRGVISREPLCGQACNNREDP